MSGTSVIRYLLANNAGVIAVVPAARIVAGVIPLATALPAIGVFQISGAQMNGIRVNETGRLRTDRVQVSVYASSYATQKSLLALVLAACPSQRATVNSVAVDSIIPDGEGPDIFDSDAAIYEQSRDFLVKWVGP